MYYPDNSKEVRMYVVILFHEKSQALRTVYYTRRDMTIDFFHRWKWYFEYRYALLKVKYPRAYIKLEYDRYELTLPEEEYKTKMRNKLISAKRMVTQFEKKIDYVRANWDEFFPPEEHPKWKKVLEKLDYYKEQLRLTQEECNKIN